MRLPRAYVWTLCAAGLVALILVVAGRSWREIVGVPVLVLFVGYVLSVEVGGRRRCACPGLLY